MPKIPSRPPDASVNKWAMLDSRTETKVGDDGVERVDHAASAKANLEDAGTQALLAVALPFAAPFSDVPEGANKAAYRVAGTAMAVIAAPFLAVASAKDLVDAGLHFVAGLADDGES
jgi:hypothetical protein